MFQGISTPYALVVEDDHEDREAIRSQLETMGCSVSDTAFVPEGWIHFNENLVNIVIIHCSENPESGLALCRSMRASSTVPIIMLTNRNESVDEHMCISAGADDYIVKPLESRILIQRVQQQLEREFAHTNAQQISDTTVMQWESLTLNPAEHEFRVNDKVVSLTSAEFQFLLLLMANPRRVFSRAQILDAIGVKDGVGSEHIVDSHASRIRGKIRSNGGPEVIAVVRSVGFRLANSH